MFLLNCPKSDNTSPLSQGTEDMRAMHEASNRGREIRG